MKLFDRLFGRSMKTPIKKLATFHWKGPDWLLQFDDGDVNAIESNAQMRRFHAGEDIIPPAGAFDGFLIVAMGCLSIRRLSDPAGANFCYARLRAGESFHWNSEFAVISEQESQLLWIDAREVVDLVNRKSRLRAAQPHGAQPPGIWSFQDAVGPRHR